MSYHNYGLEDEFAVAVGAAAYAIVSLESARWERERRKNSPQNHRPRRSESGILEKVLYPATSWKKTPPATAPIPKADSRRWDKTRSKRRDIERPKPISIPSPSLSPSMFRPPPIPPPPREEFRRIEMQDTEADLWEKDELHRIRDKYEKLNASILEWEEKKKKKAKTKLMASESQVEHKRVKALQQYESQMKSVRRIAEGARAQAKAKRRNEELKVKDKANKYRATGRRPTTCLCF